MPGRLSGPLKPGKQFGTQLLLFARKNVRGWGGGEEDVTEES